MCEMNKKEVMCRLDNLVASSKEQAKLLAILVKEKGINCEKKLLNRETYHGIDVDEILNGKSD